MTASRWHRCNLIFILILFRATFSKVRNLYHAMKVWDSNYSKLYTKDAQCLLCFLYPVTGEGWRRCCAGVLFIIVCFSLPTVLFSPWFLVFSSPMSLNSDYRQSWRAGQAEMSPRPGTTLTVRMAWFLHIQLIINANIRWPPNLHYWFNH